MEMNVLFESVYDGLGNGSFTIEDYMSEGATWDTYKTVMQANTRAIKSSYKDAKAAYKDGEYDKAIKHINTTKKGYEELKKKLQGIDDTIGGNIAGWILGSGLLTLVLNVKAGGIRGFGHYGATQVGFQAVGRAGAASITKSALQMLQQASSAGQLTPDVMMNYWTKIAKISVLSSLANDAIKIVKLLINVHNMKKKGETPTWNYVKADVIASIQSNINACDKIVERCKAAKESAKTESFIFVGDDTEE